MSLQDRIKKFRTKKDLIKELSLYKALIIKKRDQEDYFSALEKLKSALILINENQDNFDLEQERHELEEIRFAIKSDMMNNRRKFLRRYHGLLNERLTEENLEDFCKLLTMLKVQIDSNVERLNLHDIHNEITIYFKYIKKLYAILSSYKILNFQTASNQILRFASELKHANYPNITKFTYSLYNDLLYSKLNELSERHSRIKLAKLSQILAIEPETLSELITKLMQKEDFPIRNYLSKTQEVVFKRMI